MRYEIRFTKSALKDLLSIPGRETNRILIEIEKLKEVPRPMGSIKLKGGGESFWRIRIGDYRVIDTIEDVVRIVEILAVGNRKDIY